MERLVHPRRQWPGHARGGPEQGRPAGAVRLRRRRSGLAHLAGDGQRLVDHVRLVRPWQQQPRHPHRRSRPRRPARGVRHHRAVAVEPDPAGHRHRRGMGELADHPGGAWNGWASHLGAASAIPRSSTTPTDGCAHTAPRYPSARPRETRTSRTTISGGTAIPPDATKITVGTSSSRKRSPEFTWWIEAKARPGRGR